MAKAFNRRHLYCLLDWPAKPLGGNIFFKTKSSGQALRVSLVKPGAYLSESYRGTGDLERLKVLQAVSEFIERHSDSRFSSLDMSGQTDGELVRDRAGYWRRTPTDDIQYLFNSAGLREALIGFDFQNGLAVLKNER